MGRHRSDGRKIGLLYLVVIVCGVFAQFYVRSAMVDAPQAYIANNEMVFRLGFLADITMQLSYLFIGIKLFWIFRSVDRKNALLLLISVVLAVALMVGNMLNFYEPVLFLKDGADMGLALEHGLALHKTGYVLAQLFFGIWLIPLGILIRKSGLLPNFIGSMLIIGGVSYLLDFMIHFLSPELADVWCSRITLPADLAEFWFCIYLLIFGFRANGDTIGKTH